MHLPSPRSRPLRRLPLLGVVPILLGVGLLIRSRQPRPKTASDAWLWEQGEIATDVEIYVPYYNSGAKAKMHLIAGMEGVSRLTVIDRQGIRALLRAFEDTGPLTPLRTPFGQSRPPLDMLSILLTHPRIGEDVSVAKQPGGYILYLSRQSGFSSATTNPRSVQRFLQALHEAVSKANRKEFGYDDGTISSP